MNKRKLLLAAIVVMILALLANGSFAYDNFEGKAKNVISSNAEGIDVEIVEFGPIEDEPFIDIENAMPAVSYDKHVKVKNKTSNAAYVRAKVIVTMQKESEQEATPLPYDAENQMIGDGTLVSIDFNGDKWTYTDGWWVCNDKLEDGQTTESLFDHVTMGENMDNSYQNSKVLVTVKVQAVQAAFNDEKTGWPEEE